MKTLLKNFTIVTMNENLDVLKDAHLIVEDGKITEVAAGAATGDFDEVIDGQNKQVLMPGLVNTHCHVPMVLMRGYGGGHDLNTWLNQYIFPVEDKLTSQSIRAGTALGVAEMIASGITSFADMYYFCDDMAEVTLEAGLNLNLSRGTTVFTTLSPVRRPSPWRKSGMVSTTVKLKSTSPFMGNTPPSSPPTCGTTWLATPASTIWGCTSMYPRPRRSMRSARLVTAV